MQLKLTMYSGNVVSLDDGDVVFTVRSEADILKAGFAVARAARDWLRRMPFVPSRENLHFSVTAEVEGSDAPAAVAADGDAPKRKRRKKASH